jgi:hypothetical protein
VPFESFVAAVMALVRVLATRAEVAAEDVPLV